MRTTPTERWRALQPALAEPVLTMSAVLAGFGSALIIERLAHLGAVVPVLAVVLTLTLSRSRTQPGPWELLRRVMTLPVVAYAAGQVGRVMLHHAPIGDTLFVLALSLAIWLRRFGLVATRIGSLITLPFIGILVIPVPVDAGTASSFWPPVLALLALAWVTAATEIGRRLGWLHAPVRTSKPAPAPAQGLLPASTKMAIQLGIALGLAFLFGHWLYPQHWPWVVLSCYLVCSGNRGRGDVLHKAVLRTIGAGVGTASATLVGRALPAGDRTAIVLIFVVLAVAVVLRRFSYAFWAAGVTAMLALLNGYYGSTGPSELPQRLGGVIIGALLGVVVSWYVLPIRSGEVFRRRTANSLSALSDYLTALRTDQSAVPAAAATFAHRVAELEQILPAYRFHRQTIGRITSAGDAHAAEVIRALAEIRSALADLDPGVAAHSARALGALSRQVGAIRQRMRFEPTPPKTSAATNDPALALAGAAISRLDAAFTIELWTRHGGRAPVVVVTPSVAPVDLP